MNGFDEPSRIGSSRAFELHVDVVDPAAIKRRQQVLGGRNQHALLHQAGGVADAGHVADVRLDFEIVEIHAAENDPRIRRRRHEAQVALDRGVQADAFDFDRALDGKLAGHLKGTILRALYGPRELLFYAFVYNGLRASKACAPKTVW